MHILRTTTVTPESMPNATLSGLLTHIAISRLDGVMSLPCSLPIRSEGHLTTNTPVMALRIRAEFRADADHLV